MKYAMIGSLAVIAAGFAMQSLSAAEKEVPAVLNFKMKTLAGKEVDLSKYQGKVLLIVNVASQCGYTPQYKGLQELHGAYADKGLVVLGVPCNQFGKQEPGSESEIAEFCKANYGVSFDMLAKVDVNGASQCGLYKHLTTEADPPGPVKWNFEKFLVGKDGKVVGRFKSGVDPQSKELQSAIETQLAKKA